MQNSVLKSVCLFLMLLTLSQASLAGDKSQEVSISDLFQTLKGGGHIVYMRHAKTDHSQKDQGENRLDDCSLQRNLSEGGRDQAMKIGQFIASQQIPISDVYSSPYCRCKETAQLAFSKYQIQQDLQFSISKTSEESKYLGQRLKEMMLASDTTKGNVVFVGHTSNLKDGLNVWPKPEGVLVIFKKEGESLNLQGMITPDELIKFAESL